MNVEPDPPKSASVQAVIWEDPVVLDFLNDVPDAAWAAIVTGLFLTGQNFLNNRRDTERRAVEVAERMADREHQSQQAQQARADARAEVWREERMNAHEALVTQLRRAEQTVGTRLMRFSPSTGLFLGDPADLERHLLDRDHQIALESAVARVELVGSERSKEIAVYSGALVWTMLADYFVLCMGADAEDVSIGGRRTPPERLKALKAMRDDLDENLQEYIKAVRIDLGTSD